MSNSKIIPGQFLYIRDLNSREMLTNAWRSINQTELWNYMRKEQDSFMFSNDPEIHIIINKMSELGYDGHSGSSFGWTMRQMQYIAKNGEQQYINNILQHYNTK